MARAPLHWSLTTTEVLGRLLPTVVLWGFFKWGWKERFHKVWKVNWALCVAKAFWIFTFTCSLEKDTYYTYYKGVYNTCQTAQGEPFTFLFVIQNSICTLAGSGALLNFPSLLGKEVLKDGTVKHIWTQAAPVKGNFTGERHLLCWNSCSLQSWYLKLQTVRHSFETFFSCEGANTIL